MKKSKYHGQHSISLDESAITNVNDYAIFLDKNQGSSAIIILYSPEKLIEEYTAQNGLEESVKGYLFIGDPGPSDELPCDIGVWSVQSSVASSGLGPMLYDIGLSVTKLSKIVGLIPDRTSISKAARGLWTQYYTKKSGATGVTVVHRPIPDVCFKHGNRNPEDADKNVIDSIYSVTAPAPYVKGMIKKHEEIMNQLSKKNKYAKQEIETLLHEEGDALFNKEMQSSLRNEFPVFSQTNISENWKGFVSKLKEAECRLSIPNLGIDMKDQPQIKGEEVQKFIISLYDRGIKVFKTRVRVDELQPSQNNLEWEKVEALKQKGLFALTSGNPIFVSEDNVIADGHHRWYAIKMIDKNADMPVFQIQNGIKNILSDMKNFKKGNIS